MSRGFVGVADKLARSIGVVQVEPLYLANMFSTGKLTEFAPDEVLCTVDEPSDRVFLLVDGSIEVSKPDARGNSRPIALVQGPAMIGHMGVIDGSHRSASCTVSGSKLAMIISLKANDFKRLLTRPDATGSAVRHLVLASLIRQLGNTNTTVAALLDGMSDNAATQTGIQPTQDINEQDLHMLQAVLQGWSLPPEG
jgi:CRP-like cAMP-binding protein